MGAFNAWVKGSFLEEPAARTVVQIARNLLGVASRRQPDASGEPLTAADVSSITADLPPEERQAVGEDNIATIGEHLFTDYVLAFELTGILLLVAVVGALALAKRRV